MSHGTWNGTLKPGSRAVKQAVTACRGPAVFSSPKSRAACRTSSACRWKPCWMPFKNCRSMSVPISEMSIEQTAAPVEPELRIGDRVLATRYFLAPLAGYTHLAFRRVVRACGGVGLATTDLVQASHLVSGTRWARALVATHPEDQPLSVQIYGGVTAHIVQAAKWLEDRGYAAVDINMGCPMAKITGQGGGARLMCDSGGACALVGDVVKAVKIPVTVKMRLGWDRERISAPALAREFEQLGVAAITIHGRTRQQGFRGTVNLDGIRAVVDAVERIPVIGNGDVRTVADAWQMRASTGCAAVAIGRGALYDPWIFRRLEIAEASRTGQASRGCEPP